MAKPCLAGVESRGGPLDPLTSFLSSLVCSREEAHQAFVLQSPEPLCNFSSGYHTVPVLNPLVLIIQISIP